MKEQLPAPEFNAGQYARPNARWICGRECEGNACPLGPSQGGRCRASAECSPVLEKLPGESKGRWRCNRPGGACEQGPLPDGTCCRQAQPCVPVRSVRGKRGRFTWAILAASGAVLLILLGGPTRSGFLNPGPLSEPHSSVAFLQRGGTNAPVDKCVACHAAGQSGPTGLLRAAFHASPAPLDFHRLGQVDRTAMTAVDESCRKCHGAGGVDYTFHQPNVPRDHSCSLCHQEHQTAGRMKPPTDANCASCHNDASIMAASAAKGGALAAAAFDFRPSRGRTVFQSPRPSEGFTRLVSSFAADHPEFQLLREADKDGNRLKFGHQLHLTSDTVRFGDGRALVCADCHQADATGRNFQRVNFERNCRVCHSLQFDSSTPQLQLPHGNPEFVSAFLRSLSKQYSDHARTNRNLTGGAVNAFAQERLASLLQQFGSGEELERRVFLSTAVTAPAVNVGSLPGPSRAVYPGCVYCHEVTSNSGLVQVTPLVLPDRWMIRGEFNHAKHLHVACNDCHDARRSAVTSDIILPSQKSCATCHSPRGGVVDSCSTCHTYHTTRR